MARKKRKSSAGKRKKKSRTVTRKKSRAQAKKPRTLGEKVSNAYRTVVDTIKGTDRLRNKLEPPATSETE